MVCQPLTTLNMDVEEKKAELTDEVTKTSDIKVFAPESKEFRLGGFNDIEERAYKLFPPKLRQMGLIERLEKIISGTEDLNNASGDVIDIFVSYLKEDDREYIADTIGVPEIMDFLVIVGKLNIEGFENAGLKVSDDKKKV